MLYINLVNDFLQNALLCVMILGLGEEMCPRCPLFRIGCRKAILYPYIMLIEKFSRTVPHMLMLPVQMLGAQSSLPGGGGDKVFQPRKSWKRILSTGNNGGKQKCRLGGHNSQRSKMKLNHKSGNSCSFLVLFRIINLFFLS